MRFGLLCSANVESSQAIRSYVGLNVEAEALGFESTFLVEHHFSGWNQVAATLMLQTCVATGTSTLRLGTGVMVLPWHNPVLLAEQVATLDVISDGRVDLGVGKGYRFSELRGFNIDQREPDDRFTEAHALFGTPDVVHDGLVALQATGAGYVLVNLPGGTEQVRRFAAEVAPSLAAPTDRSKEAGARARGA